MHGSGSGRICVAEIISQEFLSSNSMLNICHLFGFGVFLLNLSPKGFYHSELLVQQCNVYSRLSFPEWHNNELSFIFFSFY